MALSQENATSKFFAASVKSRTVSSILVLGGVLAGCRAAAIRGDRCRTIRGSPLPNSQRANLIRTASGMVT